MFVAAEAQTIFSAPLGATEQTAAAPKGADFV